MTKYFVLFFIIIGQIAFGQSKIQPYRKGDLRLDIKLPHFNHLSFNPNKEFKDSAFGFNGYGLGVECNYKNNKFLEVSSSVALTFELPFPAPVDAEYNKILYSFYINLTDNTIHNRFTFGYGLNYSTNTWKEWTRNFDEINLPTSKSKTMTNKNIGLTLNSYYRFGKALHMGLIYQPSLFNLNRSPELIYEHLISLEFNWRINLGNIRK